MMRFALIIHVILGTMDFTMAQSQRQQCQVNIVESKTALPGIIYFIYHCNVGYLQTNSVFDPKKIATCFMRGSVPSSGHRILGSFTTHSYVERKEIENEYNRNYHKVMRYLTIKILCFREVFISAVE